jgi:hypothetical protein
MLEDLKTGEYLACEVQLVVLEDVEPLDPGWNFDWFEQIQKSETYKLVVIGFPEHILGMMSIERRSYYIEVLLIESNPKNVGRAKRFRGIPGHLLAFAAELSFQLGNDGFVRLISKTELIDHYVKEYGFIRHRNSQVMILDTAAADKLISTFFRGNSDGTIA